MNETSREILTRGGGSWWRQEWPCLIRAMNPSMSLHDELNENWTRCARAISSSLLFSPSTHGFPSSFRIRVSIISSYSSNHPLKGHSAASPKLKAIPAIFRGPME